VKERSRDARKRPPQRVCIALQRVCIAVLCVNQSVDLIPANVLTAGDKLSWGDTLVTPTRCAGKYLTYTHSLVMCKATPGGSGLKAEV